MRDTHTHTHTHTYTWTTWRFPRFASGGPANSRIFVCRCQSESRLDPGSLARRLPNSPARGEQNNCTGNSARPVAGPPSPRYLPWSTTCWVNNLFLASIYGGKRLRRFSTYSCPRSYRHVRPLLCCTTSFWQRWGRGRNSVAQ